MFNNITLCVVSHTDSRYKHIKGSVKNTAS